MTSYVSASAVSTATAVDGSLVAVYDPVEDMLTKETDPPDVVFQTLRIGLVREKRARLTKVDAAEQHFQGCSLRLKESILRYPTLNAQQRIKAISYSLATVQHPFCEYCMRRLSAQNAQHNDANERFCADCSAVRYCSKGCWQADIGNHNPNCMLIGRLSRLSVMDVLHQMGAQDDNLLLSQVRVSNALDRYAATADERTELYTSLSSWVTSNSGKNRDLPVASFEDRDDDLRRGSVVSKTSTDLHDEEQADHENDEDVPAIIEKLKSYRDDLFHQLAYASHTHAQLANDRKTLEELGPGLIKTEFLLHYQLLDVIVRTKEQVREREKQIEGKQKKIRELEKRMADIRTEQASKAAQLYQKISGLEEEIVILNSRTSGELEKKLLQIEQVRKDAKAQLQAAQHAMRDVKNLMEDLAAVPKKVQIEMEVIMDVKSKQLVARLAEEEERVAAKLQELQAQIVIRERRIEELKVEEEEVIEEKEQKAEKKKREKTEAKRSFYDRFDPNSDASMAEAMTILPYYPPVQNPAMVKDFADVAQRYRQFDRQINKEKVYLLWQNLIERARVKVVFNRVEQHFRNPDAEFLPTDAPLSTDAASTEDIQRLSEESSVKESQEVSNLEEELEASDPEDDVVAGDLPDAVTIKRVRSRRLRKPKPKFEYVSCREKMEAKWTELMAKHSKRVSVWAAANQQSVKKFLNDMIYATNQANRKAGPQGLPAPAAAPNLAPAPPAFASSDQGRPVVPATQPVDAPDERGSMDAAGSGFDVARRKRPGSASSTSGRPNSASARPSSASSTSFPPSSSTNGRPPSALLGNNSRPTSASLNSRPSSATYVQQHSLTPVNGMELPKHTLDRINELATMMAMHSLTTADIVPQSDSFKDWQFFIVKVVEFVNMGLSEAVMEIHKHVEENRRELEKLRRSVSLSAERIQVEQGTKMSVVGRKVDDASSQLDKDPPVAPARARSAKRVAISIPGTYGTMRIQSYDSAVSAFASSADDPSWLDAAYSPSVADVDSPSSVKPVEECSSSLLNIRHVAKPTDGRSQAVSQRHQTGVESSLTRPDSVVRTSTAATTNSGRIVSTRLSPTATATSTSAAAAVSGDPVSPATQGPLHSRESLVCSAPNTPFSLSVRSVEDPRLASQRAFALSAGLEFPEEDPLQTLRDLERNAARNMLDLFEMRYGQDFAADEVHDRRRPDDVVIPGLSVASMPVQDRSVSTTAANALSVHDLSTRAIRNVIQQNPDWLQQSSQFAVEAGTPRSSAPSSLTDPPLSLHAVSDVPGQVLNEKQALQRNKSMPMVPLLKHTAFRSGSFDPKNLPTDRLVLAPWSERSAAPPAAPRVPGYVTHRRAGSQKR